MTDLFFKTREMTTKELLSIVGSKAESLSDFADFDHLTSTLTPSRRHVLWAAVELNKRFHQRRIQDEQLRSSKDAYHLLKPYFADLDREEFYVVYMSHSCRVKAVKQISVGGFTDTAVDIRLVLRWALELKSTCIMLAHNHPSGNIKPSKEDLQLTARVKEACKLFSIHVLDHIIYTELACYSFSDECQL